MTFCSSMLSILLVLLLVATPIECLVHPKWISTSRQESLVVRHVEPQVVAGAVAVAGGAIWWLSGSEDRVKKAEYAELQGRYDEYQQERARKAYIEPRDGGKGTWTEEELAKFDGTDEDGPMLFAADGLVFNVWKGRNFYGPGGEYHIFAGRDATRLLAKTQLEEEAPEELKVPLNIAEKAALAGWIYAFKNKYEIVGRLESFDPKTTSMRN